MSKQKGFRGTLIVDKARGVAYFQSDNGGCLLRIEGLDRPNPKKAQIDIRLRPLGSDTSPKDYLDGHVQLAEVLK